MTGSEMAEQLERVAEAARNGNSTGLAAARKMLVARRMLEALEDAVPRLQRCAEAHGTPRDVVTSALRPYRDAIAAAKGEPR